MSPARETSRGPSTPAAIADHRVLIVESSRVLAATVAARCNSIEGVTAEVAPTLAYAKELLRYDADRFCAAVVGLVLPDAPDGTVVDLVTGHDIPTIVLTGSQDMAQRDTVMAKGVADYVLKSGQAGLDYVMRMVERLADTAHKRILIVDDSSTYRMYTEKLLQQHGYLTLTATDGREGLACLREHDDIALVITDYNMPVMDGLEMTAEIRKTYGHDKLAVIAASDTNDSEVLVKFLKIGATDYVRKSASMEELFCRVDQNIDVLRNLAKARAAAYVDYLTKLPNRRGLFEQANAAYDRVAGTTEELLLAIVDVDRFKAVNDTYGHDVGDRALIEIAQVLRDCAERDDAVVGRLGGEEFVCLWQVDIYDEDYDRLENLRSAIESIEFVHDGVVIPLTASVGATRWMGTCVDNMVNAADSLLYQAKADGRNCVRYNNSIPNQPTGDAASQPTA